MKLPQFSSCGGSPSQTKVDPSDSPDSGRWSSKYENKNSNPSPLRDGDEGTAEGISSDCLAHSVRREAREYKVRKCVLPIGGFVLLISLLHQFGGWSVGSQEFGVHVFPFWVGRFPPPCERFDR